MIRASCGSGWRISYFVLIASYESEILTLRFLEAQHKNITLLPFFNTIVISKSWFPYSIPFRLILPYLFEYMLENKNAIRFIGIFQEMYAQLIDTIENKEEE